MIADRLIQAAADIAIRVLFAVDQHIVAFANDTDEADQ